MHTLRLRLVEAIERRGLGAPLAGQTQGADDSFHGHGDSALDSLSPGSLPPAGIVVDSLDDRGDDAAAAARDRRAAHPLGLGSHRR